MNEYKENVDMTFEEFLEHVAKMDFDDYIICIRSSLKAPKVFLKRKTYLIILGTFLFLYFISFFVLYSNHPDCC